VQAIAATRRQSVAGAASADAAKNKSADAPYETGFAQEKCQKNKEKESQSGLFFQSETDEATSGVIARGQGRLV